MAKKHKRRLTKKDYTTVRVSDGKGGATLVETKVGGKMAGIAATKQKQIMRAQRENIRKYKARLREVKKRYPIEERAHMKLEDF